MHEVRLLNYGIDAEVKDPYRSLSSKMWKKIHIRGFVTGFRNRKMKMYL